MLQPYRNYSVGSQYRYGFNGKEKDQDIAEGDLDFGARIYDSRLGRWFSVDPLQKKFPDETPYLFVGSNPNINIDIDGRYRILFIKIYDAQKNTTTFIKITLNEDLKSHPQTVQSGSAYLIDEHSWKDINMFVDVAIQKDGSIKIGAIKEEAGQERAVTDAGNWFTDYEWVAKSRGRKTLDLNGSRGVKDKPVKEGIIWTSKGGVNWDNDLAPDAKNISGIENIDDIISAFNACAGTLDASEKLDNLANLLSYVNTATDNIQELAEIADKAREEKKKLPDPSTVWCDAHQDNFKVDKKTKTLTETKSDNVPSDSVSSHGETPSGKRRTVNKQ